MMDVAVAPVPPRIAPEVAAALVTAELIEFAFRKRFAAFETEPSSSAVLPPPAVAFEMLVPMAAPMLTASALALAPEPTLMATVAWAVAVGTAPLPAAPKPSVSGASDVANAPVPATGCGGDPLPPGGALWMAITVMHPTAGVWASGPM